ncbi:MAG: GH3 auxin-responsive promoter family protein [Archangium sp.]
MFALNLAWAASRQAAVRKFRAALRDPQRAQRELFEAHLQRTRESSFGREHGYERIRTVEEFRASVPVRSWAEVQPYVARIEAGETNVLNTEPVRMLERTSGGISGPKHVPYGAALLAEFQAATGPWLDDLFRAFPALFGTRQYWSVSPVAREPERTKGGLRIGLEDDTEYFSGPTRFAMKRLFAVDGSVARERSLESWRRRTLEALVRADDLGFFSIWNPTFLTLLMESLERDWRDYEPLLDARRRAALDASGTLTGEVLWPRLQLISCWTDAWAAHAVPALRRFFPRTPFQGKGLLATEGVVSFPLWGQPAPVAAVTSHFLEFESLDSDGVVDVGTLQKGARYAPILTTAGGFTRYRLPDVVRCVGFLERTPLLSFEGRLDRASDLRGEKLESAFAERALSESLAQVPARFAFLAPELDGARAGYVLFVEDCADAAKLTAVLEEKLRAQPHYAYARELGQLEPLRFITVTNAEEKRVAALRARGLRLGDIKPSGFDPRPGWTVPLSREGEGRGEGETA